MTDYTTLYKGHYDSLSSNRPEEVDYGYITLDVGDFILVIRQYDCGLHGATLQPICDYSFSIYKKLSNDIQFLYEDDTNIFSVDNIYGGMIKVDNNKFTILVKDTVCYGKTYSIDSSGNLTLLSSFNINEYVIYNKAIITPIYFISYKEELSFTKTHVFSLFRINPGTNDITYLGSDSVVTNTVAYLDDYCKLNDNSAIYSLRYTTEDEIRFAIIDITGETISLESEQVFPYNDDDVEYLQIVRLKYVSDNLFVAFYFKSGTPYSLMTWLCENNSGTIVQVVGIPIFYSGSILELVSTGESTFFITSVNSASQVIFKSFNYNSTDMSEIASGYSTVSSPDLKIFLFSIGDDLYIVYPSLGNYYLITESFRSAIIYYGVDSVVESDYSFIEE